MVPDLELLLDGYDTGRLSRRELLGALAMIASPRLRADSAPAIGVAKQLNHVTLYVRDVERSRAFYQRLFGMPVLTKQSPGFNLTVGTSFLGIYPIDSGERPRIDHFCFGLDRFDANAIQRKLASEGVDATVELRGDTKQLYFPDPDGNRVQLQDVRYRGGVGPLGDRNP
jgi:catechol 2,3-dioxygenase-like lactoylglutathione lyase family enzyme